LKTVRAAQTKMSPQTAMWLKILNIAVSDSGMNLNPNGTGIKRWKKIGYY
jgi:hypothetical protein